VKHIQFLPPNICHSQIEQKISVVFNPLHFEAYSQI